MLLVTFEMCAGFSATSSQPIESTSELTSEFTPTTNVTLPEVDPEKRSSDDGVDLLYVVLIVVGALLLLGVIVYVVFRKKE